MRVYEKPPALLASFWGFMAFRELLRLRLSSSDLSHAARSVRMQRDIAPLGGVLDVDMHFLKF